MSNIRYILFTGSMQPKNPMVATEDKIKEIVAAGFRQGKDFDIVSEKVLKDKLGRRGGGMMNMDEMTRPLGYKFGTEDGELVGDREQDLKEWEEDTIDRLRKKMEREKFLEKFLEKEKEDEGKREIPDWVEEFLEKRRKYVVVIIFAAAAILTPPDPVTQIGLAIPLLILYELSIFSVKFIENKNLEKTDA